jgi:hypothetical protein
VYVPKGGNSRQRRVFNKAVDLAVAKKMQEQAGGITVTVPTTVPVAETHKKTLGKLERSNLEAYAGLAIAIWLAVVPMTWWLRCMLLLALSGIVLDVSWRHPWTFEWPWKRKLAIFVFATVLVIAPAIRPTVEDYKRGTVDAEPHLTFSITPGRTIVLDNSRGKSDVEDVRIQAIEYLVAPAPGPVKIVDHTTIGNDLELKPFTIKGGGKKDLNLDTQEYAILMIRDFNFRNGPDTPDSWTHFYGLRFTFTNAGTGIRYVHYMVISPFRNGPDIPEHPESFTMTTKAGEEPFPFNMLRAIKADCRAVWGNELPEYQP